MDAGTSTLALVFVSASVARAHACEVCAEFKGAEVSSLSADMRLRSPSSLSKSMSVQRIADQSKSSQDALLAQAQEAKFV